MIHNFSPLKISKDIFSYKSIMLIYSLNFVIIIVRKNVQISIFGSIFSQNI